MMPRTLVGALIWLLFGLFFILLYSLLNFVLLGNQGQLLKATPKVNAQKLNSMIYFSYLSHWRTAENTTESLLAANVIP